MPSKDKTKKVLEQLLAKLFEKQAKEISSTDSSYLEAADGQYLGKITDNKYDPNSILNKYGPFGSRYSVTSVFNPYSQYGSKYGAFSINNPYCSQPPKLFINNRFKGHVSANRYVTNRIPSEEFLYTLEHNTRALLAGHFAKSGTKARQFNSESYIEAANGTFLGNINPNRFDQQSIFNQFGPYGNKFSPDSIFNDFSTYGNQFNPLSPFNKFSNSPPKVYVRGAFVGYLTVNEAFTPRINPEEILEWAEQNVPQTR